MAYHSHDMHNSAFANWSCTHFVRFFDRERRPTNKCRIKIHCTRYENPDLVQIETEFIHTRPLPPQQI